MAHIHHPGMREWHTYTTRVMRDVPIYHPGYEGCAHTPPGYGRVQAIHHLGYGRGAGYTPPRVYREVYPPRYIPPTTPWVYHPTSRTWTGVHYGRCTDGCVRDEALGSNLRLISIMQHREASLLPKV